MKFSPVGGFLSVPLSVGFRRLGLPSVLPCGVRTFLGLRARGHPACDSNFSRAFAGRAASGEDDVAAGLALHLGVDVRSEEAPEEAVVALP